MAHVLTLPAFTEKQGNQKIAEICRDLGLKRQAQRHAASCSVERDFVPMSEDEYLVWKEFCPTVYSSRSEGDFERYGFDTIPTEVIEHWGRVKQNYAFDSFTIRTTERVADPILLGWLGERVYLLARWGLESPEALPLREVAKRVMHQLETEDWRTKGWHLFGIVPMRPYLSDTAWLAAKRLAR